MLVMSLRVGETLRIGDDIAITVDGKQVKEVDLLVSMLNNTEGRFESSNTDLDTVKLKCGPEDS